MRTPFEEVIAREPQILAEGAVVERLRRNSTTPLDYELAHAGFIYQAHTREALAALHREYFAIGQRHNLPMIALTDTWRANSDRLHRAGFRDRDVNGDNARFLQALRADLGDYGRRVFIGGLLGSCGDAYDPTQSLTAVEAEQFHHAQAEALAKAGVDFLFGATLPAISEAIGLAKAMAVTGVPYVLSFILDPNGNVLDGTPLAEAMHRIDSEAPRPPTGYLANCCHPSFVRRALETGTAPLPQRFLGVQANTSSRAAHELDGLPYLETERPETFATAMLELHTRFGLRILGGCCGTDATHIQAIAGGLAALRQSN